jgi:predicted SAM-dependent methyltransferase
MLGQILRDLLHPARKAARPAAIRPRVLNVGSSSMSIPIPAYYDEWERLSVDIDPRCKPDIVCDARNLESLEASQFDAIYCSHNLEHYYRHDGAKVLRGFRHVLKSDGFVEIKVPDLQSVIQRVVESKMDLGDILYESPMGPIAVLDVIYGFAKEIEESGHDYYAHKTGFTTKLLGQTLESAGFAEVYVFAAPETYEARALAFMSKPTTRHRKLLDLPASEG